MESEDFFGYRMKNRRKELHLTQEQFAEIVNTGKNHISAIEKGKERPSLPLFRNICEALRVTPDYLLLGNARSNKVPKEIYDSLLLCNEDDLELIRHLVEYLINKNGKKFNDENYV